MPEFISIGDVLVDLIAVGDLPLDRAKRFEKHFGGAPANFAVCLARLGAKSGLIAKVGDDPFGFFLRNYLKKEGVDASQVKTCEKRTSLAFATRGDFVFYRGADIELCPDDVSESYIKGAKYLHFSGFTLSSAKPGKAVLKALKLARKHGLKVSFSVNYRRHAWKEKEARKAFLKFLRYVDIAVASEKEAFLIGREKSLPANCRKISELGVKAIVVTGGAKGALLFEGGQMKAIPAFRVKSVATVGAGDAFCAGLVYRLSLGASLPEAARFASALGAITTTRAGATSALPDLREVENFLRSR